MEYLELIQLIVKLAQRIWYCRAGTHDSRMMKVQRILTARWEYCTSSVLKVVDLTDQLSLPVEECLDGFLRQSCVIHEKTRTTGSSRIHENARKSFENQVGQLWLLV